MTVFIAIPVYRINCKVSIDKARPWSVIDEAILWAAHQAPVTISELASRANLPRQLVVASLARMMRFRLIDAVVDGDGQPGFRSSTYGAQLVTGGYSLPYFPKRSSRRISFTIERATGYMYSTRDAQPWATNRLQRERDAGADVRVISVDGAPPMSHQANVARLSAMVERNPDEQMGSIEPHTSSVREEDYLVVRVVDGALHGLPPGAPDSLRRLVRGATVGEPGVAPPAIAYAGPGEESAPRTVRCNIAATDLVVGGDAHRDCLLKMLQIADRRVIIHSTFLRDECFAELFGAFRKACESDISIDILWGAAKSEADEARQGSEAALMMKRVLADPVTRARIRIHMQSTGSHAKAILVDQDDGSWVAVVGSCNWLSSPLRAVEASVVLRDQEAVAGVARALQRIVGRRAGLAHPVANELALVPRGLSTDAARAGAAEVTILVGEEHDARLRAGSGNAMQRLVIASHRLGSTARPGALIPAAVAAQGGAKVHVLYTMRSGPVKNHDERELKAEAALQGVALTRVTIPIHAKFVAWDDDDVLITSFNWASADSDPSDPFGELGVHIHARGIATELIGRIRALLPNLALP